MKHYQILVRGKNILGQLGVKNQPYIEEYTALEKFEGRPIKQIATNMGQTFVLDELSRLIRSAPSLRLGI